MYLDCTLDITIKTVVNTYPEELGAVYTPSDMRNDIVSLRIDGHKTLVKVVKEVVRNRSISQVSKAAVNICFSRRTYISGFETSTGLHVT